MKLEKAGFNGIFINMDTATTDNFQVVSFDTLEILGWLTKAIEDYEYQAVVINPKQIMKAEGGFEHLKKCLAFTIYKFEIPSSVLSLMKHIVSDYCKGTVTFP